MYVMKSQDFLVFIDFFTRDRACYDFAKNAIWVVVQSILHTYNRGAILDGMLFQRYH